MVVGDVILDRYVRGHIERISPEAPAQVLEVTDEEEILGGAANVAANASALGAKARLVGLLGDDDGADSIKALLKKKGISPADLVTDPARPTTRKTRFIAMRQQMLRVDRESRADADNKGQARLVARVEGAVKKCDGVILSDYGKGALPAAVTARIIKCARKAGKMVIVDPKGRDYSKYSGATIITPNRKEAALASGVEIKTDRDYRTAAARLFKVTGAEHIFITRGDEGMSVFGKDGASMHFAAEALEVFDVTGAGDTVIAALAVTLFAGLPLEEAAKIANVAAAIEVGHVGARAVTRREVLDRLMPDKAGNGKVKSRAQAAEYAKKLRGEGRAVVFTNGCFDIVHAGHVHYLEKARALGDALVVGLNSDASVRRIKGKNRPLTKQDDRIKVLSALSCVDAVTVFNEDTPINVIKAVSPDILVKGGDYTPDTVVGRDVVEKRGGRVEIVPLVAGKSTTNIINGIMGRFGG